LVSAALVISTLAQRAYKTKFYAYIYASKNDAQENIKVKMNERQSIFKKKARYL
jgi:hypothetical protein